MTRSLPHSLAQWHLDPPQTAASLNPALLPNFLGYKEQQPVCLGLYMKLILKREKRGKHFKVKREADGEQMKVR